MSTVLAETKAAPPVSVDDYRDMELDVNRAVTTDGVSVCGDFTQIAKIADLSVPLRRPKRRASRTVADEQRILMQDSELLKLFSAGVLEVQGGHTIEWDQLKSELGL